MRRVKILATSDLHGIASFEKIADNAIECGADIVVVAGDVETAFRDRCPSSAFQDDILKPVKRLGKIGIEVVMVPGNHDFFLKKCLGYDNRKRFTSNLHILCDRKEKILDVNFYGTPWVPTINGRWCYEADEDDLAKRFSKIPKGIDVLVSHTPPKGNPGQLFDMVLEPIRKWHLGSSALRTEIERKCPKCVVCGHIHTGDHRVGMIGDSKIINVSALNERYDDSFSPTEFEVNENGEVEMIRTGERK